MRPFGILSEQIEVSYPEYLKVQSDITRENARFFYRLMQKNLGDHFYEALLGGLGACCPWKIFRFWYCFVASDASFWYFNFLSEQIELAFPEYLKVQSDITRENPSFFYRLMQKKSWRSFVCSLARAARGHAPPGKF